MPFYALDKGVSNTYTLKHKKWVGGEVCKCIHRVLFIGWDVMRLLRTEFEIFEVRGMILAVTLQAPHQSDPLQRHTGDTNFAKQKFWARASEVQ